MSAPRLLIIQHAEHCPPAWFGTWFHEAGVEYDVLRGDRGEQIPTELGPYDGLVVLGGEMGANDDAEHPWLSPTKALIAAVVRADQCFLGICLGHQLAAVALGGDVVENPRGYTIGLTPVALTPAGRVDPLLRPVDPTARAVHWNHDIVSRLPEGASVLATAPDGMVQAARFGQCGWGVQFHPEASPAVCSHWTVDERSACLPPGVHPAAVAKTIADAEAELRRSWAPLAQRFAGLVREQLPVS